MHRRRQETRGRCEDDKRSTNTSILPTVAGGLVDELFETVGSRAPILLTLLRSAVPTKQATLLLTVPQARPGSQRRAEGGGYSSAYYLLHNICQSAFPSLNLDISLSLPSAKSPQRAQRALSAPAFCPTLSWIQNVALSPPTLLLAGPSPCRGGDRWSRATIALRSDAQIQKLGVLFSFFVWLLVFFFFL